jgi:hypothetical protein
MLTPLEAFAHLVADRASHYLTDRPHDLPYMFKNLRADFAADRERLAIIDGIEASTAELACREIAERMGYRVKSETAKAKRTRRKSIGAILKQVSKAGNVTSVVVEGVEYKVGQPISAHDATNSNPWDEVLQ